MLAMRGKTLVSLSRSVATRFQVNQSRASATGSGHNSVSDSPSSTLDGKKGDEVLPLDSLPRYPTGTTLGGLRFLDYLGTVSFAQSGCLLAATSGMDILGASLVGTVTAVGGGTIRDAVILGKKPFWTSETEYLYLALATGLITFVIYNSRDGAPRNRVESGLEVAIDSLGVGAFCVIGAMNGVRAGMPGIVTVICGMSTATFGGVVRDILCRRQVRILHSTAEIYASTAAAGALAYLGARRLGGGVVVRVGAGVGLAVALRAWAWAKGVRLPVWQTPNESLNKAAPAL